MMIRIQQGKGRRDRDVPLSPKLLETHNSPRPPQTPAASSKSPYRNCPGGRHSSSRGYSAPAQLRCEGTKIFRQLSLGTEPGPLVSVYKS